MKDKKVYAREVSKQECDKTSVRQSKLAGIDSGSRRSKLLAVRVKGQNSSFDDPSTVVWEGGRSATLEEYRAHEFDTDFVVFAGNRRVVKHIFLDIVAEVSFEHNVADCVVRGRDVTTAALGLNDPDAGDDYIRYCSSPYQFFIGPKLSAEAGS